MLSFLFIVSIILSFVGGMLWSHHLLHKKVSNKECPFKHACLKFDEFETKAAVKRVLKLLLDNQIPKEELKSIINSSLK